LFFAFITDLLRPIGTYLYGRRLYETMAYWEAPPEDSPPERREFARIWQKAEKIVFSRTLTGATRRNTRVEREFDFETIRKLTRDSARAACCAGASLRGRAREGGRAADCLLLPPRGGGAGGTRASRPTLGGNLELLEPRRFGTGVIYTRYRMRGGTP